ncbi:hypothetical protein U1Q18_034796 [Sarracenia purpurea var. burkii]
MEPNYDLGRELKSPMANTVTASNWKRRAREAKCDLVLGSLNGDEKKRKMGIEEWKEDDDDMKNVAMRKKGRHDKIQEGTMLNLDTVETEAQPHRAP